MFFRLIFKKISPFLTQKTTKIEKYVITIIDFTNRYCTQIECFSGGFVKELKRLLFYSSANSIFVLQQKGWNGHYAEYPGRPARKRSPREQYFDGKGQMPKRKEKRKTASGVSKCKGQCYMYMVSPS